MCGRYENDEQYFNYLIEYENSLKQYSGKNSLKSNNIAPTNKVLAIDNKDLFLASWGIKFSDKSPLIFNSRIETISEKPFWKGLFDKKRCLIPMTAFYEWKTINNKKIPHRIYLSDKPMFFVAGLYFEKDGKRFTSIVTTTPNKFMENIHHRMPVIETIDKEEFLDNDVENNIKLSTQTNNKLKMKMGKIEL